MNISLRDRAEPLNYPCQYCGELIDCNFAGSTSCPRQFGSISLEELITRKPKGHIVNYETD